MSGSVRKVQSVWVNKNIIKIIRNKKIMETWNVGGPCGKNKINLKNPRLKKKIYIYKSLKTCKTKVGEVEKYLKEADVPLVGCFANDTENRFTAGIDNNSEEIKKKKKSLVLL